METVLETIEIETAKNPVASVIWMHGLGADVASAVDQEARSRLRCGAGVGVRVHGKVSLARDDLLGCKGFDCLGSRIGYGWIDDTPGTGAAGSRAPHQRYDKKRSYGGAGHQ